MEARGELIRSRKMGRLRRWSRSELEAWIQQGQPRSDEWEALKQQAD